MARRFGEGDEIDIGYVIAKDSWKFNRTGHSEHAILSVLSSGDACI
jgi:hypothetical protein